MYNRQFIISWRLAFIWTSLVVTGCISNEKALYKDLFSDYSPSTIPRKNHSRTIDVTLNFVLNTIKDLDEKNEVLQTVGYFKAHWKDDYLQWDPANYSGVQYIMVTASHVWLPDFVIVNSVGLFYERTYYEYFRVAIEYDGTVHWSFGGVFQTTCELNITYFPFDDQECAFHLENWKYPSADVALHNASSAVYIANYEEHSIWNLTATRALAETIFYDDVKRPYPRVRFVLKLRRLPRYYVTQVIIPCIFLASITPLGFVLPPESGEKVSLSVTVLLAFSVFLFVIDDKLPITSQTTSVLDIFVSVSMGLSTLSVISAILVLYIYHHQWSSAPSSWLRLTVFSVIGRILCMRPPTSSDGGRMREERTNSMAANGSQSSASPVNTSGQRRTKQMNRRQQEPELLVFQSLSANAPTSRNERRTASDSNRHSNEVNSENYRLSPAGRYLKELVAYKAAMKSKQADDDRDANIGKEWRAVARVLDRLLFLLSLGATLANVIWLLAVAFRHGN